MRARLNTGCALDALLRIKYGNQSFQVAENVVRADIDAFPAILAEVVCYCRSHSCKHNGFAEKNQFEKLRLACEAKNSLDNQAE